MPSSELQSRMTSLPTSWDPWIWHCGAEGGTTRRVINKRFIYHEPNDDAGDINIQHSGTSDNTVSGKHTRRLAHE